MGENEKLRLVVYGAWKRLGFLSGNKIVDMQNSCADYLSEELGEPRPYEMALALVGSDLASFLSGGERARSTASKLADCASKRIKEGGWIGPRGEALTRDASDVRLHAPLVDSAKVMCAGANFGDHLSGMTSRTKGKMISPEEAATESRKGNPWGFYKLSSNIVGPEEGIIYPSRTKRFDYEGEIALVFGRGGKDIPTTRVQDYILGYSIFNDYSIRDGTQDAGGVFNYALGKNFEGGGSLGPCITLKDEIPDPQDIGFSTKVNGETRQRGNTKDMIRSFAEFTSFLSSDAWIKPGDILTSGTSAGTAFDSSPRDSSGVVDPTRFLKIGDIVEVSSERIGTLRNKIIAKPSA